MDDKIFLLILGALISGFAGLFFWGIKSLVTAIFKNATEVALLRGELARVVEDTKSIPKMKEDLNALHAWKRELKGEK